MKTKLLLILVAVAASLATTAFGADKKLVLVAGRPSHGPGEHEFNAGCMLLKKCLDENTSGIDTVIVKGGWPEDESVFLDADAILLYMDGGGGHPAIKPDRLRLLGRLMAAGVGLGCAHYGVEVPAGAPGEAWKSWIGGYYEHEFSCNPMWSPEYTSLPDHPITTGVEPFSIRDEWYMNMRFRPERRGVIPILSAIPSDDVRNGPYVYPKGPYLHIIDNTGRPEVMMWAVEREDGGRGFGFTGGHFHRNWGDPNFRKVVLNALVWLVKKDVPADGVTSVVTEQDLKKNLDPK